MVGVIIESPSMSQQRLRNEWILSQVEGATTMLKFSLSKKKWGKKLRNNSEAFILFASTTKTTMNIENLYWICSFASSLLHKIGREDIAPINIYELTPESHPK